MTQPSNDPRLPAPLYIDTPDGATAFGWFHGSNGGGLPVLICGGIGAEDLSSHAFLRDIAATLSAQGQSCLRLEWPGTGDAGPLPEEADAWPHWLAAVDAAVDVLRAVTGAPRVAVLGLRLGATIALQGLQSRGDVAALVACVPVVQGRALLREWRMLGAGGLASLAHEDGSLETGGFHLNAATCQSLGRVRLDDPLVGPPRGARLLVIDRDDLPVAERWCAALRKAGTELDARSLPGFPGLMAVPHLVVPPIEMAHAALHWLQRASAGTPPVPSLQAVPPRRPLLIAGVAHGLSQPVREWPLWLDGGAPLLAVRSEPADARRGPLSGTAVLVLNTGAERRIGPHGQFVAPAREWASRGAVVLRVDLAGLGDSPAHAGEPAQRVYPATAMADIARALAYLRAVPGVDRVVALGLCSGAYHVFEAAQQRLHLDLAVAINPLVFSRPTSENFAAVPQQAHAVQQLSGEAVRNLRDPARWAKLLKGQVNWRFITATLARRGLLAARRSWLAFRRALGWPASRDVAARLATAVRWDTPATSAARLCLVFAEHDPGLAMLRAEAGRTLAALQRSGKVQVHTIAEADHTFSRSASRRELRQVLDAVLAPPLVEAAAAASTDQAAAAASADQAAAAASADQAVAAEASSTRRARWARASST